MLHKNIILDLKKVRESITTDIQKVKNGSLAQLKYNTDFKEFRDAIRKILPIDSDEYVKFNWKYPRVTEFTWRIRPWDSDLTAKESSLLEDLLINLDELLTANNVNTLNSEKKFGVNEWFTAKIYILEILNSAKNTITILDPYLDSTFYNYIGEIDETISFQIITWNQKPMFWDLYSEYSKTKNNLEARCLVNFESHDRYFLIDNIRLFHFGASLNTIWKKDFMIQEIENPETKKERISQIEIWWNSSKEIQ